MEDDTEGQRLLADFLREHGYKVLAAAGGCEALDICRKHSGAIDAVVSDVTMAGTDGQDIQGYLGIRDPNMKVIYISGFSAESLRERGVLPQESHFLQKPFPLHDLATKLDELFGIENCE